VYFIKLSNKISWNPLRPKATHGLDLWYEKPFLLLTFWIFFIFSLIFWLGSLNWDVFFFLYHQSFFLKDVRLTCVESFFEY
jgi:hypothetical protein